MARLGIGLPLGPDARAAGLQALARARDLLLLPFSQLLLARSFTVGACVLLAAALNPAALAVALFTALGAWSTLRLLSIDEAAFTEGPYGANAVFVGLGVGWAFGLTPATLTVGLALGVVTVVVTAFAVVGLATTLALPVLSWPFIVVYELTLLSAPSLGLTPVAHAPAPLVALSPSLTLDAITSGVSALVFGAHPAMGVLLMLALLVHSRIALSLAALGIATATAFSLLIPGAAALGPPMVFNAMLTAVALGGAWFVPSPASYGLAILGALVAAILTVALRGPLAVHGLPLLVLPFNAAMVLMLSATAQRRPGATPRRVDFLPGSPEQNLRYARTRSARLPVSDGPRLRLPFRGAWCCTQGVDGPYTHRGPWRHALDFEVQGADGAFHAGDGRELAQYHCFRLPVLAAGDGTVVRVENDVPDNAIGEVDLQRNWGNVVIIQHAPRLFSLVAHLARGSVSVSKGQWVKQGEVIGLCGSSGRSPRPHLHFQLQASDVLGAATGPFRFEGACRHDAARPVGPTLAPASGSVSLRGSRPPRMVSAAEPAVGEIWSHAERSVAATQLWTSALPLDGELVLSVNGCRELLTFAVDLLGRRVIRSARGGELFFVRTDDWVSVLDVLAPPDSVLHALRAALSRVPIAKNESLQWHDFLPPVQRRPTMVGWLRDFISPFIPERVSTMQYELEQRGERLVIQGRSLGPSPLALPEVRTRAEIAPGLGLLTVRAAIGARSWHAVRELERELSPPVVIPRDLEGRRERPLHAQPLGRSL